MTPIGNVTLAPCKTFCVEGNKYVKFFKIDQTNIETHNKYGDRFVHLFLPAGRANDAFRTASFLSETSKYIPEGCLTKVSLEGFRRIQFRLV